MRLAISILLPFVALVHAAAISNSLSLSRREEFVPFDVDQKCIKGSDRTGHDRIIRAVKDLKAMAQLALDEWWDQGLHQEVAATYLGIRGDQDKKYAQIVRDNLHRVSLLDTRMPFLSTYVFVSCIDQWNMCFKDVQGDDMRVTAYAKNTVLIDGHHYDIVVCPIWHTLDSPATKVEGYKNKPQDEVSMYWLENDAMKLLHEFMHLTLISEDRDEIKDRFMKADERAYGPIRIAEWIKNGANQLEAVTNADSYAQFVNAIWFKKELGYLPPPQNAKPDETGKTCHKKSSKYVHQAFASEQLEEFCTTTAFKYQKGEGGIYEWTYAEGKPNSFTYGAYWESDLGWDGNKVKDICYDMLKDVLDSCEQEGNWRFGGKKYTVREGRNVFDVSFDPAYYRPKPIPSDVVGSCDVHYRALFNTFNVYGGMWAGTDHGQKWLLPELRKCGAVTGWEFKYTNEWINDGYEWHAWGKLPIGPQMWGCVSKAVEKAGGPAGLKCTGS